MAVSVSVKGGGDAMIYQTSTGVFFDLLDASLAPVKLDQQISTGASPWVNAQARAGGGFTVEWVAQGSIMAEDYDATGGALDAPHRWTGAPPKPAPLAFASNADGSSAVLPAGGSVTGSTANASLKVQQYDAAGAANAPAFALNAPPISAYAAPVIAPLADGSYVAEYALNGNYSASLYVERFSSHGAALGQIPVAAYGGLVSLSPSSYSIAGLADGGFVAAWSIASSILGAGEQPGTYAEAFNASGAGLGVVRLGSTSGHAPTIDALADGRYTIAWTSDTGATEHQAFTDAGASLGKLDPPAPVGGGLLGGQTWAALLNGIEGAASQAVAHAAVTAWHDLAATLSGAHDAASHTSIPTPTASEALSLAHHHGITTPQVLHGFGDGASLLW